MRVVAFGNPLRRDDGVGLAVLARLRAQDLPAHVELIEGGAGALALLEEIACDSEPKPMRTAKPSPNREPNTAYRTPVLLIDATNMGLSPGAVRTFDLAGPADAAFPPDTQTGSEAVHRARVCPPGPALSLHDADLNSTLRLAQALGWHIHARVIGIQPADVTPGEGLTPAVAAAVDVAVEAALEQMRAPAPAADRR